MVHGNKKSNWDFFINHKHVTKILGADYQPPDTVKLEVADFFTYFNDGDRSGIWRKNIAIWIKHNVDDWITRREQLKNCASNSKEWYKLMYGVDWESLYSSQVARLKANLPNTLLHWENKGYTASESKIRVAKHQSTTAKLKKGRLDGSVRCVDYWMKNGYTNIESTQIVSNLQRRDKDFFIGKYGKDQGLQKFINSKQKRKTTWTKKDKIAHARKTHPKSYNEHGQEMQAIRGFLVANDIKSTECMYGKPADQFWQQIPGTGFRRYDLAVFTDSSKTTLRYIFEFHGPGHINFSDYRDELKNERITIGGKQLLHLGTYGTAYHNDKVKREWILDNNPEVIYIVMWVGDLVKKRFNIDELL